MRWLLPFLLTLACTRAPADTTEGGITPNADRPCNLPAQLELRATAQGDCSAPPIVVLYLGDDGSVAQASAHVPVGVSVPLIPCTSHAPTDAHTSPDATSCTWPLDITCEGPNGQQFAMTGTLTGIDATWTGDAVTITMTGSPPGRLMCAATGSVATP